MLINIQNALFRVDFQQLSLQSAEECNKIIIT